MSDVLYSPLALTQLDSIWDYGYQRFGLIQADKYIDGLFDAADAVANNWVYEGVTPRLFPIDMISDITSENVHFIRYENEIIYFRKLINGGIAVISILGVRMDTPNRLKEMLSNPMSEI